MFFVFLDLLDKLRSSVELFLTWILNDLNLKVNLFFYFQGSLLPFINHQSYSEYLVFHRTWCKLLKPTLSVLQTGVWNRQWWSKSSLLNLAHIKVYELRPTWELLVLGYHTMFSKLLLCLSSVSLVGSWMFKMDNNVVTLIKYRIIKPPKSLEVNFDYISSFRYSAPWPIV